MSINIEEILNQETLELNQDNMLATLSMLAQEPKFNFAMLIDLFGIDYGTTATPRFAVIYNLLSLENNHRLRITVPLIKTTHSSSHPVLDTGSRNTHTKHAIDSAVKPWNDATQLHSDFELPSVCTIWPNANWYEREVYDMFGIHFIDHPDLRRIITEYNYNKHPLCKDFTK
ncbi:MAG: NADH-quinone oxidoreductase subunit C [Gammaproteobacteria bacterium]|nr:NADH-quinone oxidoreductase subunit C [Gammaproteobacteria bacterium]